jgi:hypothetical protein
MFYAGYLLLKNNPTLGGILSLTIFGSLFFILACPHNKLIPPTKFSTALAANINLVAITTERTYPDPYGAIVTDYGRALKQGTPCSITNPQPNTHKKCLLIIRTDRFFDGVLTISSQQNILAKAVVAKRGYLFDYIVIPVSWYPSYDLTWQGGGNIGIFQCWVN